MSTVTSLGFFRSIYFEEPEFFDEGPAVSVKAVGNVSVTNSINSSSINTVQIDCYRQGVELTQQKHFDAGLFKIHAGEPGHRIRECNFNGHNSYLVNHTFADKERFVPELHIKSTIISEPVHTSNVIDTHNSDELEVDVLNGIFEPLTIRKLHNTSADTTKSIKGCLMGGNDDRTYASDNVVTVDYFDSESGIIEYNDDSRRDYRCQKIDLKPYNDIQKANFSTNWDSAMVETINVLNTPTDNYIPTKKISQTCGWTYDNITSVGTDSIAFGGMSY